MLLSFLKLFSEFFRGMLKIWYYEKCYILTNSNMFAIKTILYTHNIDFFIINSHKHTVSVYWSSVTWKSNIHNIHAQICNNHSYLPLDNQ